MNKKILAILVCVGLIAITSGCIEEKSETEEEEEVQGNISYTEIKIGDKPTEEFSHVNVTFSEVKLYNRETEEWTSVPLDTMTVDLIYLHINDLNETLGIGELDEGNYTKLWIVVDSCVGVLNETGEEVTIEVPSGTLKIQHLFDLREGNNTITVEIDLDSSIHEIGQSGVYKIVPVIGAIRVKHQNGTLERVRDRDQLNQKTGNRPPSIDILVNGSRRNSYNAEINESIAFDATGTFDIEGDTITFDWDFGDGTTSNESSVTHSYNETGDYDVTLTVSDGVETATQTITIKVQETGQGSGNGGNGNSGNGNGNGQG